MEHEPVKYISGSAFNGNRIQGNRAISNLQDRNQTNLVSLTVWCSRNFITKRLGDTLISKKLLIGQRLYGEWWVCANLECLDQLLEYLGVEELVFDADNDLFV